MRRVISAPIATDAHATQPTMNDETIAAIEAEYHQAICDHSLDVLTLSWPKLRRPRHITHGVLESCADPKCKICLPLSQETLEGLRGYACRMYKLMTNKEATDNTDDFKANAWTLDYESAVKAASVVIRTNCFSEVGARERIERIRTLAQICDADHRPAHIEMAARYRALAEDWEKERKAEPPKSTGETKADATADLKRIRTTLRTELESIDVDEFSARDIQRTEQLLYVATLFGLGEDDAFCPLRTDFWRASYDENVTVPKLKKNSNHIEITEDTVWLRVPQCAKEQGNTADINVTDDSPMLADLLRAYEPIARKRSEHALLFPDRSRTAHDGCRGRAMRALLRPGPCPHENQCTRCKQSFVCGKNGKRECDCTRAGKRSRPECGAYCGTACGHYTAIDCRHKRVCTEIGSVQERNEMAQRMGTTRQSLQCYGGGRGTV